MTDLTLREMKSHIKVTGSLSEALRQKSESKIYFSQPKSINSNKQLRFVPFFVVHESEIIKTILTVVGVD